MAEFPPNLEDGEMWLPSDMFPVDEVVVPSKDTPHHYYPSSSHLLPHRFASLAFLQQRYQNHTFPNPHSHPAFQRFRDPVRCGSTRSFMGSGCFGLNGGVRVGYGGNGCGSGGGWTGSRPVCQYEFLNPVHPQVESLMEGRARDLQRQQVRILQNRVMANRVLSLERSGVGVGNNGGGIFKEYGGTGVFLPRIHTITTTTTNHSGGVSKQGVRNKQETQVYPQRNFIRRVQVRKQGDGHYQLQPEMGLPQDWTY